MRAARRCSFERVQAAQINLNQASSAISLGLGWSAALTSSGNLKTSWGSQLNWVLRRGFPWTTYVCLCSWEKKARIAYRRARIASFFSCWGHAGYRAYLALEADACAP